MFLIYSLLDDEDFKTGKRFRKKRSTALALLDETNRRRTIFTVIKWT
jgi:hypothetical protein